MELVLVSASDKNSATLICVLHFASLPPAAAQQTSDQFEFVDHDLQWQRVEFFELGFLRQEVHAEYVCSRHLKY